MESPKFRANSLTRLGRNAVSAYFAAVVLADEAVVIPAATVIVELLALAQLGVVVPVSRNPSSITNVRTLPPL